MSHLSPLRQPPSSIYHFRMLTGPRMTCVGRSQNPRRFSWKWLRFANLHIGQCSTTFFSEPTCFHWARWACALQLIHLLPSTYRLASRNGLDTCTSAHFCESLYYIFCHRRKDLVIYEYKPHNSHMLSLYTGYESRN